MAYRDRRELIPSPLSPVFPQTPSETSQSRSLLSYVQWLFLKGQYKRTIMECRRILTSNSHEANGLFTTYLCFYAALSAEALARLAHPLALTRMESLELAKGFYEAAQHALPSPAVQCELSRLQHAPDDAVDVDFDAAISDTASVGDRGQSASRTRCSVSSIQSDTYIADTLFPKPPSVRSQSPATPRDDPPLASPVDGRSLSPIRSVADHLPSADNPELKTYQSRQQSLEYTSMWLKNKSVDLFNTHLADFQALLDSHLVTINLLIGTTKQSHLRRQNVRTFATFGDDQVAKAMDRKERLQRLKANGWARERFRAEYYEELCERALADLVK